MAILERLSSFSMRALLWWQGRRFRLLLPALPAVLAGAACAVTLLSAAARTGQEVTVTYLDRGQAALRAKDYATALTCYDRLAAGQDKRPKVLYGLATAAEGLGQGERAQALMKELTPPDQPGYGPAHFWQARRLLGVALSSPPARERARAHLLKALDGEIEDRDLAHGLLCELYMADNKLDLAEPHLNKAINSRPQLRLRAAQMYAVRGDTNRARHEAELAAGYFQRRVQSDLTDLAARGLWAEALTFLERFPEAVDVLEEGWAATREASFLRAEGDVHAVWHDTVGRESGDTLGRRLELLEQGLRKDPANTNLLERLLRLTSLEGADGERARSALRALLAGGKATGPVHFALSVDAMRRNRPEEGRMHLEQALRLSPELPMVANNLAWVLAHNEPPDLPRALDLAQTAVEQAPKNLSFRHTRGVVLAKLGRWQDALVDLEAALPQNPESPDLHRLLASAYDKLGSPDMAAEHRRQAEPKALRKPEGRPPH